MKKLLLAISALALSACLVAPNYRELAQKVVPTNVELIGTFYNLWTGETNEDAAYCSGVALTPTRLITAGHCVESAKNYPLQQGVAVFDGKIKLRLQNGRIVLAKIVKSELVETDNKSARDVALLELDEPLLTPAVIGNSDSVQVGDLIAIVGNTFGELKHSFTVGVVSYISRELKVGTFIQTDGHSAEGNSGGPVFDMSGKVIGILTRGGGGVSLILPINDVLKHLGINQ